MNEKELKKLGKEWSKNGQNRIYFNGVQILEIKVTRYNANYYSNKNFSIWYDLNKKEFGFRADGVEDDAKKAIETIKEMVA